MACFENLMQRFDAFYSEVGLLKCLTVFSLLLKFLSKVCMAII